MMPPGDHVWTDYKTNTTERKGKEAKGSLVKNIDFLWKSKVDGEEFVPTQLNTIV